MNTQNALEDIKVNVKLKLAALWTSFMFLYIYVDYFALYMPGKIEDILKGRVFVFDYYARISFGSTRLSNNSCTDDFSFCCPAG